MKFILLLTGLFFSFFGFAQVTNPEFTNLAKKYDSGKYESVLESAESLIDNDKHRKKPEPYLWASMSLLQLSRSDDAKTQERYKYGLKNALKHGGKAAKKDKNGNVVANNQTYFDELKVAGVELAKSYLADGNSRKASYTYKQILAFAPSDQNIRFAKAIRDIQLSNHSEAERALRESLPKLTESYKNLEYKPDPTSSPLLREAVVFYIDYLRENAYQDSARSVAFSARLFFPLDKDINQRFNELK